VPRAVKRFEMNGVPRARREQGTQANPEAFVFRAGSKVKAVRLIPLFD
jgi:hypothetical protein